MCLCLSPVRSTAHHRSVLRVQDKRCLYRASDSAISVNHELIDWDTYCFGMYTNHAFDDSYDDVLLYEPHAATIDSNTDSVTFSGRVTRRKDGCGEDGKSAPRDDVTSKADGDNEEQDGLDENHNMVYKQRLCTPFDISSQFNVAV